MITTAQLRSAVDTIVVVMLENRSFDHLLGFLSHEDFDRRSDIDGLHRRSDDFAWENPDGSGNLYAPTATADAYLPRDLPHSRAQIQKQLRDGAMDGFIDAYFGAQQDDRTSSPMQFCKPQDIPVTAALARGYTVCDRWFASLPSDTQPNRLMATCGDALIDSTSSLKIPWRLLPTQRTVLDWLEDKGVSFEIYVDADDIHDVGVPSNSLLMPSQWRHVISRGHQLSSLETRWRGGGAAPGVIYCEPFYNDFATVFGLHGGCNHPPLPMAFGEAFLRRVYLALTSNPAKWAKTVMIVCYDEHGGFFDHVVPPSVPYGPPSGHSWKDTTPFASLGVRIPGIIVSPLVDSRSSFHGLLDHTSILQLMVDRFGTPQDLEQFGSAATRRHDHEILSLREAITRSQPRTGDVLQVPAAPTFSNPKPGPMTDQSRLFEMVLEQKPKTKV